MKKKKIISERAHLMCPNMFFGIMIKIDRKFHIQKFQESLSVIQAAHPIISSVINMDHMDDIFYESRTDYQIPYAIEKERNWEQIFQDISDKGWDVRKESLLKVSVFPKEDFFQVLFVTHHILCDGRGLLTLVEEFADYYVLDKKAVCVEEQLLESLEDLPSGSNLSFLSKYLVKNINKNWIKEKQAVSYHTYLEFEKKFALQNLVNRRVRNIPKEELKEIAEKCKENAISINDYLIAMMMIEEHANKVIMAADIRGKIRGYKQGSLGNYATAYSVTISKPEKDLITLAKQIRSKVCRIQTHPSEEMLVLACYFAMEPTLIDAVAISSLGNFQSKAGKFAGDKMFGYALRNGYSVTNLGKIESDSITEGFFIPPASPATIKTWGVLTINGNMKIAESFYPNK